MTLIDDGRRIDAGPERDPRPLATAPHIPGRSLDAEGRPAWMTPSSVLNGVLPPAWRWRGSDAALVGVALVAVAGLVVVAFNLGSAPVWIAGLRLPVPLAAQWLVAFVGGAVAALRLRRAVDDRRRQQRLGRSSATTLGGTAAAPGDRGANGGQRISPSSRRPAPSPSRPASPHRLVPAPVRPSGLDRLADRLALAGLRRRDAAGAAAVVALLLVGTLGYVLRTGQLPLPPAYAHDALQHDLDATTLDGGFAFAHDSAELEPEAAAELDRIAELMLGRPGFAVTVVGHADVAGDEDHNLGLSERRAEAVVGALVARGVPADRFDTVGRGSSDPVADNSTDEGRAANRRVEFDVR